MTFCACFWIGCLSLTVEKNSELLSVVLLFFQSTNWNLPRETEENWKTDRICGAVCATIKLFLVDDPVYTWWLTEVRQHRLQETEEILNFRPKWWGFQKSPLSRLFLLRRVLHYRRRQNAQKSRFLLSGDSSDCCMLFWKLLRCFWSSWLTTFLLSFSVVFFFCFSEVLC